MGLDLLDFTFRIEKAFHIKLATSDWYLLPHRTPFEVTAGELHEWVAQRCVDRGVRVPWSSWNRVRKVLVDVTGKSPTLIRPDTAVVRELGFSV